MVTTNQTFHSIRSRQSVRRFSSKPLPERLLGEILELSNQSPSSFNVQPWHFILVRNSDLRRLLHHIAMEQDQIAEAPATIVFVTDPEGWNAPYREVQRKSVEQNITSARVSQDLIRTVRLVFRTGPWGLVGFLKRISLPLRQLSRPTPPLMTTAAETKAYMREQTMIALTTFVIAAESAGLATCIIDQFDEGRAKKLFGVPRSMTINALVTVGYPMEGDSVPFSVRTSIHDKLSLDLFPNKVSLIPKRKPEDPGQQS